jgi:hypothetical protein
MSDDVSLMNRDDLLEFHKKESQKCRDIMKQKNHDYTGDHNDPFANFKACEQFGVCDTAVGILVRMLDKMKRLKTFAVQGELRVDNESFVDACRDIQNYAILLHGVFKDAEARRKIREGVMDEIDDPELKDQFKALSRDLGL